jgi:predicted O-methyltransferase YrrM
LRDAGRDLPRSLRSLVSLPLRRPGEFRDRVAGYADLFLDRLFENAPAYETTGWDDGLEDVAARFGDPGAAERVLREPALEEIEDQTRRLLADIRPEDPFTLRWAADSLLARCCYLACRLLRPDVVVETGVAYGVSSAFILKALDENGGGTLHSIDLPPLRREYERYWGIAVPEVLKGRWVLHRGSSAGTLPGLLRNLKTVDLFLHDSLHTRRNMRREIETVWPHLNTGGVVLADDVERNGAFGELRRKNPALWRVIRDQQERPLHAGATQRAVFGIAIK